MGHHFFSRNPFFGRVAKLADAPDLGSGPVRDGGSSPLSPMFLINCVEKRGREILFFLLTDVVPLDRIERIFGCSGVF